MIKNQEMKSQMHHKMHVLFSFSGVFFWYFKRKSSLFPLEDTPNFPPGKKNSTTKLNTEKTQQIEKSQTPR